ncbi:PP2C family serine/threonine-protein phosphatase [Acidisphaera sp. L21]|uniref:PP2C family protein-serine/threonine phosphatase n=1 Tax=Acidisphaera sp. L21 TaxID=1641851 RepID=UPI0020B1115A|nr:protein phosphatase 2C domain-containing protein [Acidisphaera sp. L21]
MNESGFIHTTATAGRFRSWAATHCGTVRTHNEDAFINRPDLGIWVVADGAGGHEAGEVASGRIVQALEGLQAGLSAGQALAEVRLRVQETHDWLRAEAARRGEGVMIASTVVVLLVRGDHFACLWAGDSRAYMLRGGVLVQVSRDHSLVQEMVESGNITSAEAEGHPHANIITRAVGAEIESFELDKRSGKLLPGDRLLLCSDGLCKVLSDLEIERQLGRDDDAPAERLVLAALAAKANDNITAVTIEVTHPP